MQQNRKHRPRRAKQVGTGVLQHHFAIRHGCGAGDRAEFDAVRHYRMHGASQRTATHNGEHATADTLDLRSHRRQAVNQVGNLGFACHIADDGPAIRQHGS